MELPGYSGSFLSDKTRELYKNVDEFAKKYSSQYNSSIFLSRLLLKPTVVVTDNATVRELLADKEGNFEMGYKEFFYEIYGDVLLFLSGEESKPVRAVLESLMTRDHGNTYTTFLEKIMDNWMDKLETSKPIDVYKHFKKMSTHISLSLFLGIDPAESANFVDHLIELTTTHWHGIISIPLNVKIPLFASTTYRKALDAKAELLEIIRKQLQVASVGFISQMHDDNRMEFEKQADHILLFVSALVPKALAAILTAFIFSSPFWYEKFVDLKGNMKEEDLLGIILEVERCWPPFVGGRRVANKDCQLGGYLIPKGYGVIYLATSAHRDPSVFSNPEEFIASRWTGDVPAQRSTLFTFGAGSRSCIGTDLMEAVILKFCRKLMERFQWEVKENGGSLKWMPVSRPKDRVIAVFKSHISTSEKDQ
ncbi:beta-amyrin 11-oxidase-like [Limulus polyphemus]|uniref:Beta-amyrin 11-oxidase-like n=1 Tax=Limulus polyphemus TaxID=6850 RepID=A0ABM1SII6_LIMPO|nr:beta-amyrin 11-oxidase-like [Limulus polyphemus]